MTDTTDKQEPEYWQWRRKCERWGIDRIYRHEVFATTDDSEVRQLFATPPANPAEPVQPQWLPIETAPKDKGCLIGLVNGSVRFIRWGKTSHVPMYGWCLADQGVEDFDLCDPTHWMSLPGAPKGTT